MVHCSGSNLYGLFSSIHVASGADLYSKAVAALLAFFQFTSLRLHSAHEEQLEKTKLSSQLELVAAIALCAALYTEHRHAIRGSALISLFLAASFAIDASASRFYHRMGLASLSDAAAASATARMALLVLDEVPKVNLIIDPIIRSASGNEATSGFWSRTLFFFLGPIFRIVFRRTLRVKDLPSLGLEYSARYLLTSISHHWPAKQPLARYSLLIASLSVWKTALLIFIIPRLLLTGFLFSQPYVLSAVLASMGHGEHEESYSKESLMTATIISYMGSAVCYAISTHMKNQLVIRVRGSLISQIMDKRLRLNMATAQEDTAIALFNDEIKEIEHSLPHFLELPFSLFESVLGMHLLARFIQQSSFVVLVPLVLAILASMVFSLYSIHSMSIWEQEVKSRVSRTSKVVSQLQAIKVLGLDRRAARYVQHLQWLEIEASKRFRAIRAFAIATGSFFDLITPTVVVAASLFSGNFGKELRPRIVYPTLTLVVFVQEPLALIFKGMHLFRSTISCFESIQSFLCQEEHRECRVSRRQLVTQPANQSTALAHLDNVTLAHLDNVTLAPFNTQLAILRNVTLRLSPGSIYAMFGPTYSGKTTVMHGLLGEAKVLDGSLFVDDASIGFCGQIVWLPDASVQDCIVAYGEYDEVWFNSVVECCLLSEDLLQLPGGKEYVVGHNGAALSLVQRQKIGIARAAYASADLVLLDDPFDALDSETSRSIIRRLCGPTGLFRRSGTTVVIASYLAECLNIADQYIFLDGGGNLSVKSPAAVSGQSPFIRMILSQQGATPVPTSQETPSSSAHQHGEARYTCGLSEISSFWLGFMGEIPFYQWLSLLAATLVVDILPTFILKYWIGTAPESRIHFIGYAAIPPLCACMCYISVMLLYCHLCPRAISGVHAAFTEKVFRSPLGFLTAMDPNMIKDIYSHDMRGLSKDAHKGMHNAFYYTFGGIALLVTILWSTANRVVLMPMVFIFLFGIQRLYLRTSEQLRHLALEVESGLVASIQDVSDGLIYIRAFGWQSKNMTHSLRLLDQSQKPTYFQQCVQALLSLVLNFMTAFLATSLVRSALYLKDGPTENSVGFSFLALAIIASSFQEAIEAWTDLETTAGSLGKAYSFIKNAPQEPSDGTADLPTDWPSQGEVDINIAWARYVADDTHLWQTPVLRNISLSLAPGTKTGLTGQPGSGKSSLLLAILGILEYSGSIVIDGVDIATVPRDQLRSRIITLTQDPLEFDGTIRDNLLPFDEYRREDDGDSDERTAAERDRILCETLVRLRLWDPIVGMGGLDATMEEAAYSPGEIQLLAIARGVVRRRLTGGRLVLVDEATGGPDTWRDHTVREMLMEYFRGCTILLVANREDTIADASGCISLTDGRIATRRNV